MIEPTIGRVVLFRPKDPDYDASKRYAALVANVNDDGTVNLMTANEYGVPNSEQNITLVQGDDSPECGQCEWMAYQKGQAAKTEALEATTIAPDNVSPIKGDDIDPVDHGVESTDDTTDDITAGAEGTGAPGDDVEPIESAALMGLKAHSLEVALESIKFLDAEGEPAAEGVVIVEAEYTFHDGVSFCVNEAEHALLVKSGLAVPELAAAEA